MSNETSTIFARIADALRCKPAPEVSKTSDAFFAMHRAVVAYVKACRENGTPVVSMSVTLPDGELTTADVVVKFQEKLS